MKSASKSLCVLLAFVLNVGTVAAQLPADWASRLPHEAVGAIEELVAVAAAEGLPTESLIQKALEGTAKSVAPERIVAAVRLQRATLRDARFLLAGVVAPAVPDARELEAVAFALHRGLPPGQITRLLLASPADRREVALEVAADIVAHGYAADAAADLVAAALSRQVTRRALTALPRAVTLELQRGLPPAEALSRTRARIVGGEPGRVP